MFNTIICKKSAQNINNLFKQQFRQREKQKRINFCKSNELAIIASTSHYSDFEDWTLASDNSVTEDCNEESMNNWLLPTLRLDSDVGLKPYNNYSSNYIYSNVANDINYLLNYWTQTCIHEIFTHYFNKLFFKILFN